MFAILISSEPQIPYSRENDLSSRRALDRVIGCAKRAFGSWDPSEEEGSESLKKMVRNGGVGVEDDDESVIEVSARQMIFDSGWRNLGW